MIEDLFGNLPYDDYKGSIPKPAIDFDRALDFLKDNSVPITLTTVSILIGVIA